MAKIKRYTVDDGGYQGELGFYCQGCKCIHFINDKGTNLEGVPKWEFNGDYNNPTISPSILIQYLYGNSIEKCHSFIKDGMIQYLSDCTHEYAGKTLPLLENKF